MSQLEVDKIVPQSGTTLTIGDSGDTINFADGQNINIDTNTLYIDSTNNRVGIGTASPSVTLDVNGGTSNTVAQFNSTDSNCNIGIFDNSTTGIYLSAIGDDFTIKTASSERMRIDSSGNVGIGTSSPTARFDTRISTLTGKVAEFHNSSGYGIDLTVESNSGVNTISSGTTQGLAFATNSSSNERMRIDSSGNLLVGKSSLDYTTVGTIIRSDGALFSITNGANTAVFERLTSDGDIIRLGKDGTVYGKLGIYANDLYIGTTDTGLKFNDFGDYITPFNPNTNAERDNAIGLGTTSSRFTDLYLSDGVYLGGTGTANKLDDYEEGTWTPTASSGLTSFTISDAYYVKIGNLVHVDCYLTGLTGASSSNLTLGGLPYTVTSYSMGVISTGSASPAKEGRFFFLKGNTNIEPYYANSSTALRVRYTGNDTDNYIIFSGEYYTTA